MTEVGSSYMAVSGGYMLYVTSPTQATHFDDGSRMMGHNA